MKRKRIVPFLLAAAMMFNTVLPAYAEEIIDMGIDVVETETDAIDEKVPEGIEEQGMEPFPGLSDEVQTEDAGELFFDDNDDSDAFNEVVDSIETESVDKDETSESEEEIIIGENMDDFILEEEEIDLEQSNSDLEGVEIDLEDEIDLEEAGSPKDAAYLSGTKKRKLGSSLYAGMSGETYTDSYGGELLENYATVYHEIYTNFMTDQSMNEVVIKLSDAILFSVDISDPSKGVTATDITKSEDYRNNVIPEIQAIGQAANDALIYDCPEMYWINNFTIGVKSAVTVTVNESRTQAICAVSKVSMKAKERFDGAYANREDFFSNVNSVYSNLSDSLKGKPTWEIVKGIHDYICGNASYGQQNGAEVSHTAAGFFLYGDKSVVCDGYAKAMQVLCNRFGIKCVLIAGDVYQADNTEAHAWNYVLVDGSYYLVDTTWDDDGDSAGNTYFLKGWDSIGIYGKKISAERHEYNAFSKSPYSSTFARPTLSNSEYHVWENPIVTKEPTCVKEGERTYTCSLCGEKKREDIPPKDHQWTKTETVDIAATCEKEGMKSIHCLVCGVSKEGSSVSVPANGHSWGKGVTIKTATCFETGNIEYICTACGKKKQESIPKTVHRWNSAETVDVAPTCEKEGRKSIHCSVCGITKEGSSVSIPATGHSWGKGVIAKKAICTADGIARYTCSNCKKERMETIQATGHKYSSWTLKTPASIKTCSIQKRTCLSCGHEETRAYGPKISPKINVPSSVTIAVNQKKKYKANLSPGDLVKTWKTSNKKIVTVKGMPNGSFTLTAQKKSGSAYIYITTGSKLTKRIKVTVKPATSSISNVPKNISIKRGKSYTLKAKKKPSNSIDTITYASSNTKVATVNAKGKIVAKKKGTAVITVKAGSKVKKCKIKVK